MIRDATIDDLPAIVGIYNAAIPGRMATADLESIKIDSRHVWFAEHSATTRPPAYHATAEISVYVAPSAQRRGHGRQLLAQAINQAPAMGLRTLLGFIFGHNEPSLALFHSFGFETWARLPKVAELDGLERDLLILGRRLP